jgi:Ribbon-helix-helix protein
LNISGTLLAPEVRTARLTILIDPRKKAVFERLCAEEDATPSQVVRRLIRAYIEERQGRPWRPEGEPRWSGERPRGKTRTDGTGRKRIQRRT